MKAKRYTYELTHKEHAGVAAKKRMTEAAATKANDALRNGVNVEQLVWKMKAKPVQAVPDVLQPVADALGATRHIFEPGKPAQVVKPKRTKSLTAKSLSAGLTRFSKGKDAFGGRLGTRMSKINKAVIDAGAAGATVLAIAEKLGEPKGIVGAQLGWIFNHKNVKGLTRTTEGDTFRYVYTA